VNRLIIPLIPLPTGRFRLSAAVTALAASGLISAIALTGCGSGQLSQTASQVPAIDGARARIKHVALRNVRIQAVQAADFLRPGAKVDLMLVAVNESPDTADKLVGITTDIGTVTVSGDSRLPSGGTLFVGAPDGRSNNAAGTVAATDTAKASVELVKPISNGLTYNFTFNFEKAGSANLAVPISAGPAPRQNESPAPAGRQ
jgi:copper(I)-binding protein